MIRNKHGLAKYAKRIHKLEADLKAANARILVLEARLPIVYVYGAQPAMPTPMSEPNPWPGYLSPYLGGIWVYVVNATICTSGEDVGKVE